MEMVIVGGGIGGLAAALACARAAPDTGRHIRLLERSAALSEVGAGIQLGPNVVHVLETMGLGAALAEVAAFPERLEVRNALNSHLIGCLPLGAAMVARYGAAYATVARADLHGLLLVALQQCGVTWKLGAQVDHITASAESMQLRLADGETLETGLLVGADGLWSKVRQQVLGDAAPRATGHLAYRAMVAMRDLPLALRSTAVTAWLGPHFHVVQYPVRGGQWLNVVAIVHGQVEGDPTSWDHSANADELRARLANTEAPLLDLVHAIPAWRLWPLYDRPPMGGPAEQAQGRVALLGDAAHPMRPYMAQGAGMAIEDAAQLAASLQTHAGQGQVAALQHYAQTRWQRNARVQARSIRNGGVFHLRAPASWGRDWSLKLLGQRLLDVPWLYGYSRPA
jgi:salicylate hydroxylase